MAKKYKITNYGNTRKFPYKGQYYEITKNSSIETDDEQLSNEFSEFLFVDVEAVEQSDAKTSERKKKATTRKKNKKIKRGKVKENKDE